jgi:ribosomal-protein-alanine N-acetyltransferase
MTLEIGEARASDVPVLAALASECGLSVDFRAELERSYAWLRVAREAGKICGFLLAWRAADELQLTDLGVTAASRRRGVARTLIGALCDAGRRGGSRVVLLEVRESNLAALALYGALGFEELDRRPRYYSDTGEDAVVMRLELR